MRVLGRRWLTAVVSLGLALLLSGTGLVAGSFVDTETSLASSFQAWTSTAWVQTTQADFGPGLFQCGLILAAPLGMWDWRGPVALLPFRAVLPASGGMG